MLGTERGFCTMTPAACYASVHGHVDNSPAAGQQATRRSRESDGIEDLASRASGSTMSPTHRRAHCQTLPDHLLLGAKCDCEYHGWAWVWDVRCVLSKCLPQVRANTECPCCIPSRHSPRHGTRSLLGQGSPSCVPRSGWPSLQLGLSGTAQTCGIPRRGMLRWGTVPSGGCGLGVGLETNSLPEMEHWAQAHP